MFASRMSKEAKVASPPQGIATLSPYATVKDLLVALGGKDALLDAYVAGQLPSHAEVTLEADPAKLQCWLLVRLLRRERP